MSSAAVIEDTAVGEYRFKNTSAFSATAHKVPSSVIKKFDVEVVDDDFDLLSLINQKIKDPSQEEDAFYFVDLGVVVRKYRQWVSELPRVKPFFAIKCNPNSAIIRTLAAFGCGFDCASKTEIQKILGIGVDASRIIYANPCKMKSHVQYARSSGVEMMTFDNADELHKIHEVYPAAKLILRIITDDSRSICKFSSKFGAPLTECPRLLRLAKALGMNVMGVSFHVGSGCRDPAAFAAAVRSAHSVFEDGRSLGMEMTLLDLGGGYPGIDDEQLSFGDIAAELRPVLDELFGEDSGVQIIAEPGRYFVAESHTLAVNVFSRRVSHVDDGDESERTFLYYINDGVYQSFNCILFDHYEPAPLILNPKPERKQYRSTIFGPTCDSMDCIAKNTVLEELEVGDWLYFRNMGAYTAAAASNFNGFKAPTTFYLSSSA